MMKYLQYVILSLIIITIFIAGCSQPAPQTNDKSAWATYVDKPDGIKIKYPSDWSIITDKVTPVKTESTSITLENVIHIYTPDNNGVIQIMGFDYPTLVYSGDIISDEMYNVMVDSFAHGGGNGVSPVSVTRDDTAYIINNNSARHLTVDVLIDKTVMNSDVYIVRHNDVYYTLSYLTIDPSAKQYSETAKEIMMTFTTVEWKTSQLTI